MPKTESHILSYHGIMPKIDPHAFVAPGAVIIGDVEIGPESSIWFGCVLRGDVNQIRIGARTNIQDGTVIHAASGLQPARMGEGAKTPEGGYPTIIGDNVTIGHMTLLHACTIESNAFVGMKAAVMDGAKIESQGMLAAGALLTPGRIIKPRQLWAGSPAKFWRDLTLDDTAQFDLRAAQYAALGAEYLREVLVAH
jgi:carbonic anhydrase/acetyltransferase-like protein (isoleucine patch superfamily)